MSSYTPRWVDREAWLIVSATLRRYPREAAELALGEEMILSRSSPRTVRRPRGGSAFSDPTGDRAAALSSGRRAQMERRVKAVGGCLARLDPDHLKVVCLRLWGVPSPQEAVTRAGMGRELGGLKYESVQTADVMAERAGYSVQHAKRIMQHFVFSAGKALGEM